MVASNANAGISRLLFTTFITLALAGASLAQDRVPFLERSITLSLDGVTLGDALRMIAKEGGFTFSYSSKLVNESEIIQARFTQNTIRQVLDELFKGRIDYRERGKYIILIRSKKTASAREPQVLSGYVIDEATGRRLENVSIYDPVTLSSAITDEYGFFKIEVKNPTGEEIRLAVNKLQYTDTLVVVPGKSRRLLNVPIRFDKERIETLADSVGSRFKRIWRTVFQATEEAINMENISDTLYRRKQFSFVPFIGTNGGLSGNVINDYSFNLFGGYSLGNRKFELGGLFNAIRGNVTGVQIAGLANGVLGKQRAVQLAGLTNMSGDSVNGVQVSGLANLNFSTTNGFGLAGLANIALGSQRGIYASGFSNISTGEAGPVQLAGFFNFAKNGFRGGQLAGFTNLSQSEVNGAQVAGFANIAGNVSGIQIASFFNMAKEIRGLQLGLFNYSKSMKGVPVGLVSFVAKGYHKLEISADEVFYTNIAFRTGVQHFHNILTVGARPATFEKDQTTWSFGYGVGTAPRLAKWLSLNFDVTSSQIVAGRIEKINLLNKVYGGFDFHLTKNLSIIAGITLNGLVSNRTYTGYPELFSDYQPELIRDRNFRDDLNLKMWWGGKVGLRFF